MIQLRVSNNQGDYPRRFDLKRSVCYTFAHFLLEPVSLVHNLAYYMTKFIQKNLQNVYKQIASLLMGAVVLTSVSVPGLVATEVVKNIDENGGILFEAEPPDSFPVAQNREPRRVMWVVVTAYSLEAAQTDSTPCIPANGEDLCALRELQGAHNTVAANFLRFGTQVKLPELFGNKTLVVRDRMNARYNGTNRIDVVMDTRAEAIKFGVKYVKMEIY
ncbi:MAG: hypothetical protein COV59_00310 [Candidatus Magasanikbacteria bacterium CG11_big_fil_rev_8_21_14_0_20_39_34]|uniref:3D domain-containing protein n=1 Tax=Candidatus Magasanikbacteria bacterium CG11_big_fil_rev_8_21_14_0_20_39_34 TaxID=1974653 RepID=A0A2H0N8U0_9BACT|nr:MAG: hypothetical protein COV59_00310 [Candidatus Magasanikbacteria bacterium CG11_big_fil_rev_8_21_14_0_20_39_34]